MMPERGREIISAQKRIIEKKIWENKKALGDRN